MNSFQQISFELESLLVLTRGVVGVKMLTSQSLTRNYSGVIPKKPLSYCNAVKGASLGKEIILTKETSGCPGSSRALGFVDARQEYFEGKSGFSLGLFKDVQVASKVAMQTPIFKHDMQAIVIKPLSKFESEPDVVMVFSNSREMMRLVQGYTFQFGLNGNFNISGNQALCVEATMTPFAKKDLNISLLCSGTRYKAKWGENELVAGFPFEMSKDIVDGLKGTVNAVEQDERKKEIEDRLAKENLLDFEIEYGKTYYENKTKKL